MHGGQRAALWMVLGHSGIVALLGIRPTIPLLREALHESQVGAYTMFSAHVESNSSSEVVGPEGERIPFNYRVFLWHNPFINTTHSHLSGSVAERFAEFLANRSEVRALVPSGALNWKVLFQVRYRRDSDPWHSISIRRPIAPLQGGGR